VTKRRRYVGTRVHVPYILFASLYALWIGSRMVLTDVVAFFFDIITGDWESEQQARPVT
jgi:hypothetical protein